MSTGYSNLVRFHLSIIFILIINLQMRQSVYMKKPFRVLHFKGYSSLYPQILSQGSFAHNHKSLCFFVFSPSLSSCGFQTLELVDMSRVLYHCATAADQAHTLVTIEITCHHRYKFDTIEITYHHREKLSQLEINCHHRDKLSP